MTTWLCQSFRCLGEAASYLCTKNTCRNEGESEREAASDGTQAGPALQPLPFAAMSPMSDADLECIQQRHFFQKPAESGDSKGFARQIVGAGKRCRHGWPQAIMYDPLYREKKGKHFRLGDITRLTCPLLVTAIDKLEKGGAMEQYNERLGKGAEWEGQLEQVNEAHRVLRLKLIGDRTEELEDAKVLLGEEAFAIAMRSGLASLRPEAKPDVKCLHAQVADELIRDGNNKIAQQALRDIEDQGTPIHGSDECCDNCNVQMPLEFARWRLKKCKNNVGKRLSRDRKQATSRAASLAASLAGDTCVGDADEDR
eukprot:gb/GFBE01035778.1/.p1 GENE.gb/GFBE01035778.1/~~gb/GFBE01035778.1/.p1  ORF type:complete len:312 (+),score=56.38 gb/GFBE01035778.1/:1-936(+)